MNQSFKILILSFIFVNIGCVNMPKLLPAEQRTKEYPIQTNLNKRKSFQKINTWAARTFTNSNETVKLRDSEQGLFIAKGNISCSALKLGNGYGEGQRIDFTLEIKTEDNNTTVKTSNIVGETINGWDGGMRPSNSAEFDSVTKECLDPFVEIIRKELI